MPGYVLLSHAGTCTAGAGVAPEFTYTNVLVEDLLMLESWAVDKT